ncbi:MAG: RNA degradosome polyphosphate kinase [Hyphomonadaceae bacterium]|nr:RNA degradosome polyphosphate kinase [Hyphomonadaceae bacterium]MBC6412375.1 RNA degradosome polyphosphate kinase [Hyphomonadaceae bacterium]
MYFNRELSWLFFNTRVLEEAQNEAVPLLERLRFLSISAGNLDEFYMVRVAGLRTQILAGMTDPSSDGYTPKQQLDKITKSVRKITDAQKDIWESIRKSLGEENIKVKSISELTGPELDHLKNLYENEILPVLSPMAVDPAHPFPFVRNLGSGLVLSLQKKNQTEPLHAIIPIPQHVPRFIHLSSTKKTDVYVRMESALHRFAPELFPDFEVMDYGLFRVTRDSDIAVDEEAEDLVRHFEFLLKKRRRGGVIRLEVNADITPELLDFLVKGFECRDDDIQKSDTFLGMVALSDLISCKRPYLLFKPYKARFPERIRDYDGDCFAAIAAKDILVHHPYEEFDVVVQFLQQAALDPDVVAIKQTLYRTSDDSPIVKALIEAAERGKAVTALVELKARFDEESNIRWARDLERAGAHVVYGFVGYKTHAKVSLAVRRENRTLRTYTHLGTGNYHAQNAKIYTDLALFTADPDIGSDAGMLFNYVTSYSRPRSMNKLVIAPLGLKEEILSLIADEIQCVKDGKPGHIWAKMNALVDTVIVDKLYEASQAGVQIDLVVRGICCLRPGVPGLSDNIRVKSIVGRFLEHSRIACFGNGAALPNPDAKIFISSADWMPRNLNRRVETLVPVEAVTVRRQVMNQIMIANLNDETNSWDLLPSGKYVRVTCASPAVPFSAHAYFMENPSLSGRGKSLKYSAPKELDVQFRTIRTETA